MKMIEAKIKKLEYSSLSDMRRDIELMIKNCRTYNEDGSILYKDATTMEVGYLLIRSPLPAFRPCFAMSANSRLGVLQHPISGRAR